MKQSQERMQQLFIHTSKKTCIAENEEWTNQMLTKIFAFVTKSHQ